MKLSATQQDVLRLMSEGWELGHSGSFEPKYWLQKNGLGKGGETKDVRLSTFLSLQEKGLIGFASSKFPFTYYGLTEEGKEAIGEANET